MMAFLFNAMPWLLLVAGLLIGTYYAALSAIGTHYARKEGSSWLWLFTVLAGLVALAGIAIAGLVALAHAPAHPGHAAAMADQWPAYLDQPERMAA